MATTFDPAFNPTNITLSNGNLTATGVNSSTNQNVRTGVGFTSGKVYWEATLNATGASNGAGVGIENPNNGSGFLGGTLYGWCYTAGGIFYNNGSNTATWATYAVNDVICIAVDITAKKLWIRKNGGNWNNTAGNDPATNVGGTDLTTLLANNGTVYPAMNSWQSGDRVTMNFGVSAFTQSVPAGFSSLDPFVLPPTGLIWTDGFESYTAGSAITAPWVVGSNSLVSIAQAHGGTKSLAAGTSGVASNCYRPIGSNLSQWYVDFWMLSVNTAQAGVQNGVFVSSNTSSSNQPCVTVDGTGAGKSTGKVGLTFFTFSVSLGVWHHYLFEVLSAVAGTAKLTVDGTVVGTFSGDTRGNGVDSFAANVVVIGASIGPTPPAECYVDDLSVYGGPFVAGGVQARAMVLA